VIVVLSTHCDQDFELKVQGSDFRVSGLRFRVQGSGFRFQVSGFRVQGSGFRPYWASANSPDWLRAWAKTLGSRAHHNPIAELKFGGSVFRFQGSVVSVQGWGFRVQGPGFRVQGPRSRVQGSRFGFKAFRLPSLKAGANSFFDQEQIVILTEVQ